MADMERRGYRVHGRVQGVGFRWSTMRAADRLGIAGTVANLADGSVEVHACGSRALLERFEELLRRGPAGARVDRVETISADPGMPTDAFRVRHVGR